MGQCVVEADRDLYGDLAGKDKLPPRPSYLEMLSFYAVLDRISIMAS